MDSLKHSVVTTVEAAAPRGRVLRLQVRLSVDLLITMAVAAFALGTAAGYQLMRRRGRAARWGRS